MWFITKFFPGLYKLILFILTAIKEDLMMKVLVGLMAFLTIADLYLPPIGVIDPSVLHAIKYILYAMAIVRGSTIILKSIEEGASFLIKHNNTSIHINPDDENKD